MKLLYLLLIPTIAFCGELKLEQESLYHAQKGFVNLDLARQSQIDPTEEHHSQIGKGDEEGRFGKVAASPNSQKLTERDIYQIGLKVWQNECRGTLDGLVFWNPNEEFPSLGIGHFIWYPTGSTKKFEETFPALIDFLSDQFKDTEKTIPTWIKSKKGFPWKTREAFLKDVRGKKVRELRTLLSDTLDLQISFLFERFKTAEVQLLPQLTEGQKAHLEALKNSPKGGYALLDYVNFKGTGLSPNERYRSEGWGLLQVLQNIPDDVKEDQLVSAFATSAKKVLARRVRNSPATRNEEQWLNGWYKRIESYSK
ncbi:MAG: hypothetical protein K1000chlam2_01162 [Chlamydiae bacterium]|nr:hypothetical protein [Chlamydiota bacterium]